jgi:hypothetical protein
MRVFVRRRGVVPGASDGLGERAPEAPRRQQAAAAPAASVMHQ